jgi:MSHA biogenesis protein MshK
MAQAVTLLRVVSLALLLPALATQAQGVPDPTRPPAALNAPPTAAGGGTLVRAESAQPQLQSILVSLRPGGRRVAVIDGKTVRQGERVGGALVVAIGPSEVVLRRGSQTQTLKLFRPAVRVATAQP